MAKRFVVLRHDCPRGLHWDFMLEAGGALRTWALADEPSGSISCVAQQLPDHRPAYLDYEGEVSGGRGSVTRYDRGEYLVSKEDTTGLVVELRGTQMRGTAVLMAEEDNQRWRFLFESAGTAAKGFSDTDSPSPSPATVSGDTVEPATNNSSSLS